jgi:hypothetical protein
MLKSAVECQHKIYNDPVVAEVLLSDDIQGQGIQLLQKYLPNF